IDGDVVQRPYTLTSTGEPEEAYEITVKREPHGVLSRWLFDRAGERTTVEISRPQGTFCWDVDHGGDVVCMVAGIGVTPAIAMMRAKLRRGGPGRLLIHYSVRDGSKAAFGDELRTVPAGRGITVRVWETGRHGRTGDDAVRGLVSEFPDARFFVCG